ncbi:MAG: zinc-binding dehydrogenase [Chloroflexi bacterium]|nr:zinc-binding dehydrogenase [Chloroflexota bacterium]
MKALYVPQTGDTDVLTVGELPGPTINGPLDVIVRVRAAAVNRLDTFERGGSHGATPRQFPHITGKEFAGEVAEVGPDVTRLKVGDRVFGTGSHTHAEYVKVDSSGQAFEESVEPMPAGLSYEDAAAIPTSFSVAYHMLHCDGKLRAGEDVLVMAAGSGTGSSGIQLAKAAGARVITTAGTDEKLEKATALGADEVINYQTMPEFAKRVLELTGGQGVDLVFEHIGAPVWENCWASLKRGGRLVSCGVTAGHRVSLHLGQLWMRRLTLIGSVNNPEVDLKIIQGLVEQGAVHPVVDSVMPLEDAAEAHRRLEARDFFGKIVLTVAS